MVEASIFPAGIARVERIAVDLLDAKRIAVDGGHLGRIVVLGHAACVLKLLGLAARGVKMHGLVVLGGGVGVYKLHGDRPVVGRLGCPEVHVLDGLARTDIWPLGKVNALVQLIGRLAFDVAEHGSLAGGE